MTVFGPGTLQIGETGAEIDASCLVNGFKIETTPDFGDPTYKLCGTSRPGSKKFTWQATGNLDVDDTDPDGLFALSQEDPGAEVAFVFTPNTVGQSSVAGTLILVPMTYGADAYGDDMTADITWPLTGKPTYTFPPVAPLADDQVVEDDAATVVPSP